ncbi:MAG TPA: sensor histidine kinase [Clostridiales bacterium]|nr:sensor histidine kinase [Clostridiales bacterium]
MAGLMSKLLKFKSIRTTIVLSFTVLIVSVVLIFATISYSRGEKVVFSIATDYVTQLNEQINRNIDTYISYMENVAQLEINNEDVKEYLFTYADAGKRAVIGETISAQFSVLRETRQDIHNIGIIGRDGSYLINDRYVTMNKNVDYHRMEWFQEALKGNTVLTTSHVQNIVADDYQWVVTLSNGITNPETGRVEGVFFIDLNYSLISSLCESIDLSNRGYVFIVDDQGNIIYHPKQQLIYSGVREENIEEILSNKGGSYLAADGDKIYFTAKSENTGWTVVGVSYKSEMMEQMNETRRMYVVLAILLLVLATVLAVIFSNALTKPIKELRKSMKEVETGNFDIHLEDSDAMNEIGHLQNSFRIMIYKIRQLIENNKTEQEAKRKSELRALQAQINPHFLYNTLDSIIWMAESSKTEEVIQMTSALSKLLRKSISNEDELVTVEREIDYVKEYLTIQKMRYQDKLEYEIHVDEEVLKVPIAKLVLQPLVENAIYHGIKYKEGKGLIQITGFVRGADVVIQIKDNGMGMEEEKLQSILVQTGPADSKRVGVQNVHSRLQLYYGKDYGVRYESKLGEGTTVSITVPYLR